MQILSCGVNDEGALGRATADEEEAKRPGFVADLPVEGDPVVAIAAGDSYGAALTEGGLVWAWGTFRVGLGRCSSDPFRQDRRAVSRARVDRWACA